MVARLCGRAIASEHVGETVMDAGKIVICVASFVVAFVASSVYRRLR